MKPNFTRRSLLLAVPGMGVVPALIKAEVPEAVKNAWNVREFGAKGDGRTLDTKAIQAAIEACHKGGGGIVYFPAGGEFLTGTIYLKSHVTLHVATNAKILGSMNLADYPKDTGLNPYYPEAVDPCLIYAKDATGVGLTGDGTIIGRPGDRFQPAPGARGRDLQQRPMLIRLEDCRQVGITNLSLGNCGAWCVHLKHSQDIFLRNVRIDNDRQDGFNIEGCQNVTISDCHLACGDDAIALTTSRRDRPLRNLTVTNCLLKSRWAGIRLGPLSKGNFENITVSNCVIYDCKGGGIKIGMFEGAEIRDCLFTNIVMDQVTAPISMFIATWPDIGSTQANRPMMPPGRIRNLQFRGIRAITMPVAPGPHPDHNAGMFFHGYPRIPIENVTLSDIHITLAGGGTRADARRRDIIDMDQIDYRKGGYWTDHKNLWGIPPAYGLYARHLKGLMLDRVHFELAGEDLRSPVVCLDSQDISISRFKAACHPSGDAMVTARNCSGVTLSQLQPVPKAPVLLRLEGERSGEVTLFNNDARRYTKKFECADGAQAGAIAES